MRRENTQFKKNTEDGPSSRKPPQNTSTEKYFWSLKGMHTPGSTPMEPARPLKKWSGMRSGKSLEFRRRSATYYLKY